MGKIQCYLWSMAAVCLSAVVPLYGNDSDDEEKPAPTVRKTLKEIVALFPSKKEELISDTRPMAYRIEEKIPRFDTVASRFNDITQLFKRHIGCDRPDLCRDTYGRDVVLPQNREKRRQKMFYTPGCLRNVKLIV